MIQIIDELYSFHGPFVGKKRTLEAKEQLLLAAYTAAAHYALGIRTMLDAKPMVKTSNVLLRSIFEAWVKVEYIAMTQDSTNAYVEIIDGLNNSKYHYEQLQEYFEENSVNKIGTLNLSNVRANAGKASKDIDFFVNKLMKENPAYSKKSLKRAVSLKKKALLIDKNSANTKLEQSAYFNYQILYHYLSGNVHLGVDGLTQWTSLSGKSIVFNNDGESLELAKRTLWTTIALLKSITITVMRSLDEYEEAFDVKYQEFLDKN